MEVEFAVIVGPAPSGAQQPEHVSISTATLLILFILIVIAGLVYREPKLAPVFAAVGAMGALLVALVR